MPFARQSDPVTVRMPRPSLPFQGRYASFCVHASLEGHAIDCGCQA